MPIAIKPNPRNITDIVEAENFELEVEQELNNEELYLRIEDDYNDVFPEKSEKPKGLVIDYSPKSLKEFWMGRKP